MPKIGTYAAALIGGVGTVATSVPVVEHAETISATGWGGMVLGGFSVMLAVTGMIMSFLDKRKVSEADTNLAIIKDNAKTIEYLNTQNAFLRDQLIALEANFEKTRQRAHEIADTAHAKLLAKETEVATLRAWIVGNGFPLPEFPNAHEEPPTFPKPTSEDV